MAVNTKEMQAQAVLEVRRQVDMTLAMKRINAVEMPMLVISRDRDHNQAVFRLSFELFKEAGKDVEWKSYDHDHHGFIFIQRNTEGKYDPDPIQREAVTDAIAYLDRYMK